MTKSAESRTSVRVQAVWVHTCRGHSPCSLAAVNTQRALNAPRRLMFPGSDYMDIHHREETGVWAVCSHFWLEPYRGYFGDFPTLFSVDSTWVLRFSASIIVSYVLFVNDSSSLGGSYWAYPIVSLVSQLFCAVEDIHHRGATIQLAPCLWPPGPLIPWGTCLWYMDHLMILPWLELSS